MPMSRQANLHLVFKQLVVVFIALNIAVQFILVFKYGHAFKSQTSHSFSFDLKNGADFSVPHHMAWYLALLWAAGIQFVFERLQQIEIYIYLHLFSVLKITDRESA